jgi:hypothetical protein
MLTLINRLMCYKGYDDTTYDESDNQSYLMGSGYRLLIESQFFQFYLVFNAHKIIYDFVPIIFL